MRLDYLADGSPDCPLLRFYDFTPVEAQYLLSAVKRLASGVSDCVEIHRLPFVEPIDECRLTFIRKTWDQAVIQHEPSSFECGFTADTWENVAGLIEPFSEGAGGFQWLAGTPGIASVLLSVSGQW